MVVDLYSRYPKIAKMLKETKEEAILHLSGIIGRHGSPEILINAGQWTAVCIFRAQEIIAEV